MAHCRRCDNLANMHSALPPQPVETHLQLLQRLQHDLDAALRPLLLNAPSVALLDFPDFSNVGDSAIWLGALNTLARLGVAAPCHSCDARRYDRASLARRIGRGVILLNGGGNFGDLWPRHQLFRERIIADFPDNPIVMMPQSMHFVDPQAAARARSAFRSHEQLTILLRDRESFLDATQMFGDITRLVPDTAFGLAPMHRSHAPDVEILWLKRADQEDRWAAAAVAPFGDAFADWAGDEDTWLVRLHNALVRATRHTATARTATARTARGVLRWLHPRLAGERLDRGVRLLSRARVVVTDRLHGHILCLLLGVPHVVLDNSYGKLSRFIAAWSHTSALVKVASSPAEAREMARALLNDGA